MRKWGNGTGNRDMRAPEGEATRYGVYVLVTRDRRGTAGDPGVEMSRTLPYDWGARGEEMSRAI